MNGGPAAGPGAQRVPAAELGVALPPRLPSPDPLAELFPPYALVLRAPHSEGEVTLRVLRDADFPQYTELLRLPIFEDPSADHVFPWYDVPEQQRRRGAVAFQWSQRGAFSAEGWHLNFGVWLGERLVGAQTVEAAEFARRRVVGSGSWLTLKAQGRGIGSLMRRMAVALAFDHLGAQRAESAALLGNERSVRTSRAVGYADNGTQVVIEGERTVTHQGFVVTPETFRRGGLELTVEGLTDDARLCLGASGTL